MAIFISADSVQPLHDVVPANGSDFSWRELCNLLSCQRIDLLPLSDGRRLLVDEEGKSAGKPVNARATQLAGEATPGQLIAHLLHLREEGVGAIYIREPLGSPRDAIAGNALLCEDDEVQ